MLKLYVCSQKNKRAIRELIIFILGSLIISVLLSVGFASISIIIANLIGSFIVVLISKNVDRGAVLNILLYKIIAIVMILIVYYGNIHAYGQPYFMGGSDDLHFETIASDFIKCGYVTPWDYPIDTNCNGMYWIVSLIMRVSGGPKNYNTIAFRILNMDILISMGLITYKISRYMLGMDMRRARVVQLVSTLFPNMLYISAYVFRDTLCAFIIILSIAVGADLATKGAHYIISSNKIILITEILILGFIGYWLRKETLFIIIVIVMFSFFGEKISGSNLIYFVISIFIGGAFLSRFHAISYVFAKASRYFTYQSDYITSHNSSALYSQIFLEPIFPFGIIFRAIYGLIFPLPTGILNLFKIFDGELYFADFMVSVGTCFQVVMMPFLITGVKRNQTITLIFIFEFISIIFTTFTFRHFIILYPTMFIIMLNDYNADYSKRRKKLKMGFAMLAALAILYFVYKYL